MHPTTPSVLALLAALLIPVFRSVPMAAVDPGSELITCDRADERIDLTVTSHLDPSCTWTRGVEILASDVTLDCQGAHIAAPDRRYGVYIHATTDTPLANITMRNCHIEGFLNNVHIEREGFRDLAEGVEYVNGFSNITIEDSTIVNSRGVGIFVNGYVEVSTSSATTASSGTPPAASSSTKTAASSSPSARSAGSTAATVPTAT